MKNKKLLSVLVSAVLLCACIAGVFMMGANAEVVATTYEVGAGKTYATIKEALHAAAGETWAANSALVIEFTGEDTSAIVRNAEAGESTNLFFGQTTIFNAEGKKLPITIKGTATDRYANAINFATNSANANVKHFAFANDYTFENLYFAAAKNVPGEGQTYIYAGSGNVVFQNVAFKPAELGWADADVSDRAMNFNGDNFTMDAFYGWNLAEGEIVETSITFGENTEYFPGDFNMSSKLNAIGYDAGFNPDLSAYATSAEKIAAAKALAENVEFQAGELASTCAVKPVDTKASFIVDTGADSADPQDMCSVRARRPYNSRSGYGNSPAEAVVEIRSGNVYNVATSGNANNDYAYVGDITINILGGAVGTVNENYCVNMPRGEHIYGDLTLNVSGNAYLPKLWQTVGNASLFVLHGTYTFNMTGGTVGAEANQSATLLGSQSYGIMGRQGTITNITGGTINGNYYAAYLNQGNGGTLPSIPTTYSEYIDGTVDIYNFVGGDAKVETFVGGYYDYANDVIKTVGNIVNVINGDAITNFIAGNYTGHSVAGQRNDQGFGNLTNIFTGGTFAKLVYGNASNDSKVTTKTIKNVILDGTFKDGFIGGAPENTYRDIINIVKGGTFNSVYYGGGKDGATGNVTNTIFAGTFKNFAYLGGKEGSVKNITNVIYGGDYASHIYGGPMGGDVNGNISTTISGTLTGAISEKNFYGAGGSSTTPVTVKGNVTNRFEFIAPSTGNNINVVIGGSRSGNIQGNISNYFVSGKFDTLRTASYTSTDTVGDVYNEYGPIEVSGAIYAVQCKEVGNITNKINGLKMTGTDKDMFLGNIASNSVVTGNITNEFTGAVKASRFVYCAGGLGGITNNVVKGNVTNTVNMTAPANGNNIPSYYGGVAIGTVEGKITNTVNSGAISTYYGGSKDGTTGDVANTISGGKFAGFVFFGSGAGTIKAIENKITAGEFANHVYGASASGTVTGNISTTISGTPGFTPDKYFYGGGGTSETVVSIEGNITNRFEFTPAESGNNIDFVVGGTRNGNCQNISNYFVSGKFRTLRTASNNATDTVGDLYNEIGPIEISDTLSVAQCKEVGNITNKINGMKMTGTNKDMFLGNIANNSVVNGNITNELKGEVKLSRHLYCAGGTSGATNYVVKGDVTTTVSMTAPQGGKNLTGAFYTGGRTGNVEGKIETIFNSGSLSSVICGAYADGVGKVGSVVNTFNGATMTYLETCRGKEVGSVTNNFNAGTVPNMSGIFYAGGIGTTKIGSVTNNITGTASFTGSFYAGAKNNANIGNITNNITGGTFAGLTYLGSCAGTTKDITNTISGASFKGHVYGASLKGTVNGNVTNTITGTPEFDSGKIFYGGGGDSSNAVTITGSITNEVNLAEGGSLAGGFRGGSRNGSCGNITNKLISGNFAGINGANQLGNADAIVNEIGAITSSGFNGANQTVTSITNTFNGSRFTDHVFAGVVNGTVTGNITNTITGACVFARNFFAAGGASGSNGVINGNVTTTISATPVEGTNNFDVFYGGVRAGSVAGKTSTTVNSGVFSTFKGGAYGGITDMGEVESTIKGGTFKNIHLGDGNATCAYGAALTLDLANDITITGDAKVLAQGDVLTIKGGAGKLVIGAESNIVASSVSGTLNVLMTAEPVANQVYISIAGDVAANIVVSAAEGVTSPVVTFDGSATKVKGASGNTLKVQLLISDKISIRALFEKAAVQQISGFTYKFEIAGKTVSGTVADMEEIEVNGVVYYAVTLDGLAVSEFKELIKFTATEYLPVNFSITSLAVAAEDAWTQANETKWVAVAQAIQNLSAVYNDGAVGLYTPAAVEGTPAVTKYPLINKVQANTLSVAPIMNGAVGLRFTFTLNEAPKNGLVVEVGGVKVNNAGGVTVKNNVVTAEIYFDAQCATENVNFLFLDGSTAYFCVNTSVAQIVAQSAANSANSDAARANANALLYFLQTVNATKN